MHRILREPLLHFAVLGIAIFALFWVIGDTEGSQNAGAFGPDRTIVIDEGDTARLDAGFEALWNRPPDAEERAALVENLITEEILVREALSLGLDQNDAVIRNRLRQKMDFLLEASAPQDDDDAALTAWFEENGARFVEPPRLAFTQVFIGPEAPSEDQIAELQYELAQGLPPETAGVATLLPMQVPLAPEASIDGTFGRGVFAQVLQLGTDAWEGPVQSGYGYHLVRVDEVQQAKNPELSEIRPRVEAVWRDEIAATAKAERLAALRDQYEVIRTDGANAEASVE